MNNDTWMQDQMYVYDYYNQIHGGDPSPNEGLPKCRHVYASIYIGTLYLSIYDAYMIEFSRE